MKICAYFDLVSWCYLLIIVGCGVFHSCAFWSQMALTLTFWPWHGEFASWATCVLKLNFDILFLGFYLPRRTQTDNNSYDLGEVRPGGSVRSPVWHIAFQVPLSSVVYYSFIELFVAELAVPWDWHANRHPTTTWRQIRYMQCVLKKLSTSEVFR